MEDWASMYAKYFDRPVFLQRGVEVGGSENNRKPSNLFTKHFRHSNVTYLGRCQRHAAMKNEEVQNSSFRRFIEAEGLKTPRQYRMAYTNPEAGYLSLSKYDKYQPILDEAAWDLAGEWTTQHFLPSMGGSRVLSQGVCINESDKQTSCGYPWSLQYHKKAEFYESPRAMEVLGDYWDLIGSDNANKFVPIWTCSQKVELRDVEKLMKNKLRTFTASPVEHSIALNRMCLDMNNKFYASNNKHWSFVGGNKYFLGWDSLYTRLNVHPNAFELDESEFDSSLFARAMFGQVDIRWNMLRVEDKTPENWKRLCALYESIVHSVIVLENGELVQKHTGNPSGSANTIVDNTMILFRLFAYAWIILAQKLHGSSNDVAIKLANVTDVERRSYAGSVFGGYSDFMKHVEAALNGDDNTFTVSNYVVPWFNPRSIADIWSSVGVTTKTPCWESRQLKDVTFLSSSFQKIGGIYLPKPETERVLCSLLYGGSNDDVRWHLLRASALRIDSWANEECRVIIQKYIEFLNREYANTLAGTSEVNGISMSSIREVWKTDLWIWNLYSGQEGTGSDVIDQRSCLNFLSMHN